MSNSIVVLNMPLAIRRICVLRMTNFQFGRPIVCVGGERDRDDASGTGEEKKCLEHYRWRHEDSLSPRMKSRESRTADTDKRDKRKGVSGCRVIAAWNI